MKNAIAELIETIDSQKSLYAEVLRLTESEAQAVMGHKVEEVMTLTSQKEMLLKRLLNPSRCSG